MPDSTHDFGKDLLPRLVARGEPVFAYPFAGYWQDVGTLDSYYDTNLAFVSGTPPLDLSNPEWVIHTQSADRPPVRVEAGARVARGMLANGCHVQGEVVNSVLFPGVIVGRHARLRRCIIDKGVRVPAHEVIGEDPAADRERFTVSEGGVVVVTRQALGQRDEFDVD